MSELKSIPTLIYQELTCFCQVCGFHLSDSPVSPDTWEYIMICPCCRMHYANDDITEMMAEAQKRFGHSKLRFLPPDVWRELKADAWMKWRVEWVTQGMHFWHQGKQPEHWNPRTQLLNLGIEL